MSPAYLHLILLCFKTVEVAAVISISAFIICYSLWASWWSDAIGRTIVLKDLLLIIALTPTVLSLFFNFSRFTSLVAAWVDIAVIGLITPLMIWRIVVFWKIHRKGRKERGGQTAARGGAVRTEAGAADGEADEAA